MFEGSNVINEELKHNIKNSLSNEEKTVSNDEIIDKIRNLNDEDKKELLRILKEVENEE